MGDHQDSAIMDSDMIKQIKKNNMYKFFWSILAAMSFLSMHFVHIVYAVILGAVLVVALFIATKFTNRIRKLEHISLLTKKQFFIRGFILPIVLALYGILTSIY